MQGTILKTTTVCLTALLLAACGGGDGSGAVAGTGGDMGTGGSNGGNDGSGGSTEPGAPSVTVSTKVAAPGLASSATAQSADGASFSWELTAQPDGSELTADDLEDANEATVKFYPQLGGEYELTVTATLDGKSAKRTAKLTVKGYEVPFSVLKVVPGEADATASHVALMVNSGGGDAREVGCAHVVTAAELGPAGQTSERNYGTTVYVPQSLDETARIASRVFADDEATQGRVELAHETTACNEADPDSLPVFAELGAIVTQARFPLHFSPDGSRLLTVGDLGEYKALYTADSTTGELHTLHTGNPSWPVHNGWANDEVLLQHLNGDADPPPYQLLRLPDADGSLLDATLLVDCTGVPAENAVMPLVQVRAVGASLIAVKNGTVYRLDADEEGAFACTLDSAQNHLLATGVGSLDVAKDGSLIAFEDALQTGIFVAPIATPGEPLRIAPADGTRHMHPRFALGGAQVVWTSSYEYAAPAEGETTPFDQDVVRVFRANADGTQPYVLWQSSAAEEETIHATGGTQRGTLGCTFGLPLGSGSAGLLALAASGLLFVRRRRAS
jgi:hypothetical protein